MVRLRSFVALFFVLSLCISFNKTHSYKFFDTNSISWNEVLSQICGVKQSTVFCKDFDKQQKKLDSKLSRFFQWLEALPYHKRIIYIDQMKNILPRIDMMIQQQATEEKLFMLVYIRAVFTDIISYYDYQDSLIVVNRQNILWNEKNHNDIRREIVRVLLKNGWDSFIQRPYIWDNRSISVHEDNRQSYSVDIEVSMRDDLDIFIEKALLSEDAVIELSPQDYKNWWKIVLFKSLQDLQYLWYDVVSHRKRFTNDKEYRRFNISKSFSLLGQVRVINPWETISFLEDSQFDPSEQTLYREWKVIFLDDEIDDYGWWLCGWSTAIYQWVLMNKWLQAQARNHTKRYSDLYTATINWEVITTPWLDSTIYYPYLDLKFTNVTDRPIILVNNYTWEEWVFEEVFTLWNIADRWSIEYVSSYYKSYTIKNKEWEERQTHWRCYKWLIHWEPQTKCYKEVF